MEKFETLAVVGEGSYGVVMKCKRKDTNQIVAIKKFLETEEDKISKKVAYREIKILKMLHHDHLVNLIEVFKRKKRFYLVFEFIDHTILNELDKFPHGFGETATRKILWQVLKGIEFFHAHNIIHRDIKPENILISRNGVVKVCDFGFARTIVSTSKVPYTAYVATRWYRAPELLVGDSKYGKPVDVWAVGCLAAEILSGDPLFPGDSDLDQLSHIVKYLGDLIPHHKALFDKNPVFSAVRIPVMNDKNAMKKRFSKYSADTRLFIQDCLNLDPSQRPTCSQLLKKPFFQKDSFSSKFPHEIRAKIQREKHYKNSLKLQRLSAPVKVEEKKNKQKDREILKQSQEVNLSTSKKPEVSKWLSILPNVQKDKLSSLWHGESSILRPDHCTVSDAMPPITKKFICEHTYDPPPVVQPSSQPCQQPQENSNSPSTQGQQRIQFLRHHLSSFYTLSGEKKGKDRLSHLEKKKIRLNEPDKREVLILPKMANRESYEQV
ncbi:cyclin-dependent kinase-like 2 [Argonauta hians]